MFVFKVITDENSTFVATKTSELLFSNLTEDDKVWCRFAEADYSQSGFQVIIISKAKTISAHLLARHRWYIKNAIKLQHRKIGTDFPYRLATPKSTPS